MLDASRPECGRPFAIAELLSVDVAASRGREEERCIQTRRQPSECLDDAPAQPHAPSLAVGFRSSRAIATAYSSSRHWSPATAATLWPLRRPLALPPSRGT